MRGTPKLSAFLSLARLTVHTVVSQESCLVEPNEMLEAQAVREKESNATKSTHHPEVNNGI